jgi:hypothetical protein
MYQCVGIDKRITNDTLAVAFLAETANSNTWLFAAHDQIWMMFRHWFVLTIVVFNGSIIWPNLMLLNLLKFRWIFHNPKYYAHTPKQIFFSG